MDKNDQFRSLFNTPSIRVLNFSHQDLDGAAAAIIVKNSFDNYVFQPINYGPMEDAAVAYVDESYDKFDVVVFTDFTPHKVMVDTLDRHDLRYLVLDHHKTAEPFDRPNGLFILDTSKCGAMLAYDYFLFRSERWTSVDLLKNLAIVANDHDMWIHKIPASIQLNRLYYLLDGAESFIEHFIGGLPDQFSEQDAQMLADLDRKVEDYFSTLEIIDLPHNGCYLECTEYLSDISLKLDKMYGWYVLVNTTDPMLTKLSFRCRIPGIDVGAILKGIGMGGGGHPAAAGQHLPKEYDWKMFIMDVHEKMFSFSDDMDAYNELKRSYCEQSRKD